MIKKDILVLILVVTLALISVTLTRESAGQPALVTVMGTVYDTSSLAVVGNAIVTITGTNFNANVTTDSFGRYALVNCPTDRTLQITCSKAGYRIYSVTIPAISGITTLVSYVHDISLQTLAPGGGATGAAGYGDVQTGAYYIIQKSGAGDDDEYVPGVDPGELEEREEAAEELEGALEGSGDSGSAVNN